MSKVSWNEMSGKDADIMAYAKRRKHVQIRIKEVRDFLKQYKCLSGFFKRGHLSRLAREWLEEISIWHFSLESFDAPFPTLSWWVEDLQTCRKHLIALWHALVEEGLLLLPSEHKRGKRLRFSAQALLDKVREWLQSGGESEQVVAESQPEPDPWDMPEPILIQQEAPEPEEDSEEVPEPVAAMVAAPEWDMALPGIKQEVGASAFINLFGIRAYWIDGKLTLKVRDRAQWNLIDARFKRVIQRHLAGYDVVIPCPARSAAS